MEKLESNREICRTDLKMKTVSLAAKSFLIASILS